MTSLEKMASEARSSAWTPLVSSVVVVAVAVAAVDDLGTLTHLQLADVAARVLDARSVRPYRHVIVDEAQDFHAAQWRVVRAAVRPAAVQLTNDLFIVGDAHQRIYDHRVVLSHLGIETRGRSRRLRLNYRTSHQIHRWAVEARRGDDVDDLDGAADTLSGSRSAFTGPQPTITAHPTAHAEADAIAADITRWLTDPDLDLHPHEIAVVARTNNSLTRIEDALAASSIRTHRLTREITAPEGRVVLSTMHRVKGGEYRAVILTDITASQLPLPQAVTPEAKDKVRHDHDIERERSLLYVAASRARELLAIHHSGTPSPLLPGSRQGS
jgi:superfamily I DNA/RNA helicase